jgi:alpha-1,6-mannosyltransferase
MTHRRSGLALAALGIVIFAITAAQASLHTPGELGIGSYALLVRFVVLWGVAGVCYLLAVALVLRAPPSSGALAIVLAGAVLLRVVPLVAPPFLSSDVYRYVWDGRVQAAGFNPYCCIPSAPDLAALRDAAIYPFINRSDYAPTIYPPVAQMVFRAVAVLSPTVIAMKLAMALADLVGIGAMVVLLRRAAQPAARVLIYAWHPMVLWEYAGNGHVDALAIAWIGLTLLAASSGRQGLAGVALAGATLTKFLPAAIGPAVWLIPRGTSLATSRAERQVEDDAPGASAVRQARPTGTTPPGRSSLWRLPATCIAAMLAAYACYASVGGKVFGFLGGYVGEEGVENGSGLYPIQLLSNIVTPPNWASRVWLGAAAVLLVALSVRMLLRPAEQRNVLRMGRDALLLATVLTVAASPHYAWYFGWLAYLACLSPWPSVVWLTIAAIASYLDTTHTNTGWANLMYGPFAALAVRDIWRAVGETKR